MGSIFEELVRRFNEENNEEAGEHWTCPSRCGRISQREGGLYENLEAPWRLRFCWSFSRAASALVSVVFVLGAWENGQTDLGKSEHEHRNLRHPQRGPLT